MMAVGVAMIALALWARWIDDLIRWSDGAKVAIQLAMHWGLYSCLVSLVVWLWRVMP